MKNIMRKNQNRILSFPFPIPILFFIISLISVEYIEKCYATDSQTYLSNEKFKLSLEWMTQSKLYNEHNGQYKASTGVTLLPTFILPQDFQLRFSLSLNKELTQDRQIHFNHGYIALQKAFLTNDIWKIMGETRLVIPMDKDNRKSSSFFTQVYLGSVFKLDLKSIGLKKMSIIDRPYLRRDFYRYKTNADGKSNTVQILGNNLSLNYNPTDPLNLSMLFSYQAGFTSKYVREDDQYSIGQEISFQFPQKLSCTLGHSNRGVINRVDGHFTTVRIKDFRNSVIYFSLGKEL